MSVERQIFGQTHDGETIERFTLKSAAGLSVGLLNWGATICSIQLPDGVEMVLGYDNAADYLENPAYFGSTVGRFCGRIANARFSLNGQEVALTSNDGKNHLHGGAPGFSHRLWCAEIVGDCAVRMQLQSADGDQGYAGNLDVSVLFELEGNELSLSYAAQSDRDTVINLTNHIYFNLRGAGNGTVQDHRLQLPVDRWTPVDETWIPTGAAQSVEGTDVDFRTARPVGDQILNHYFCLNEGGSLSLAARLTEPESGRVLEVLTDQPGLQLYTGCYLDEPFSGLCLETQHAPDAPNQSSFPTTTLRAGERFESTTMYCFLTQPSHRDQ